MHSFRDPKVFSYQSAPCPDMKKHDDAPCPRGDDCPFAHNIFEYWLHPSRYNYYRYPESISSNAISSLTSKCTLMMQISDKDVPSQLHSQDMLLCSFTRSTPGSSALGCRLQHHHECTGYWVCNRATKSTSGDQLKAGCVWPGEDAIGDWSWDTIRCTSYIKAHCNERQATMPRRPLII